MLRGGPDAKLLAQVRDIVRKKHYSIRTEQSYVNWIKQYIIFQQKRHPKGVGEKEISRFLSHQETDKNVAASTQNQALNTLVFLHKHVLRIDYLRIPAGARCAGITSIR